MAHDGITFKTVRGKTYPVLQVAGTQSAATDLTLVAAPGAGKRIAVLFMTLSAAVDRNIQVRGSGVDLHIQTVGAAGPMPVILGNGSGFVYICADNTALVIDSTDAGANTTSVFCQYVVLDTPESN